MVIIVSTSSFLYGYIDGTSSEIKVALKREAVRTASAACSCASVCVGINFTLCIGATPTLGVSHARQLVLLHLRV